MADFCAVRGIRFVEVIAPGIFECPDLFGYYPYREIHRSLNVLKSERTMVLDPLEASSKAWDSNNAKVLWVTGSDPYKSVEANRIIAEYAATLISDNGLCYAI